MFPYIPVSHKCFSANRSRPDSSPPRPRTSRSFTREKIRAVRVEQLVKICILALIFLAPKLCIFFHARWFFLKSAHFGAAPTDPQNFSCFFVLQRGFELISFFIKFIKSTFTFDAHLFILLFDKL